MYKETLKAIAKRAIQEMTKSMVNWINSGFHGAPLFLENPDSFFEDIAKSEVRTLVDQFGYDSLKYPFGKDFALNTINSYKRTLEDNTSYSLSKVINDPVTLRRYQTDFNFGGWNGFLVNTQYPQNNYIGFQISASEELSRRVAGTGKTAVDKVNDALQQGQGFLSPKKCETNPSYNDGKNEWNQPKFDEAKWVRENPYDPSSQESRNDWTLRLQKARAEWGSSSNGEYCPPRPDGSSGFVSTTPGSVVASQIMNSLGSGQRQGELNAALGNSMSLIFDALLSKFIGDGLSSLTSESNSKNDPDTWSYDGLTLGSPGDEGVNYTWDMGPDDPIYINKFKKDIEDGIANTETELQLITEITDKLSSIWPRARVLDVCLPGPDISWEKRLEEEKNKNDGRIQKAYSNASEKQENEAEKAKKELKLAVDFFKNWIIDRMMSELPSSILSMDAIKDIEALSQGPNQLTEARRTKAQALVRLQSILSALNEISEIDENNSIIQPEPDSFEEQILIQLRKQYDATRTSISNFATIADRQNELFIREEQLSNIENLIVKCEEERVEKGWPNPAGLEINPEQAYFCDLPIIGGYTHEPFIGTALTHPELPMVNAAKVLKYKITTIGSMLTFSKKTAWVTINLSCNNIYNATILDYKGNLPGPIDLNEKYIPTGPDIGGSGSDVGICEFFDTFETEIEEDVTQEYCDENGGGWTQNP